MNTKSIAPFFSLLTSSATLICCALPALFVSLGLGATFVGLITAVPQLIWFSEQKIWVFTIAGCLITASFVLQYRNKNNSCPLDPIQKDACEKSRKLSLWVTWISAILYIVGAMFAFILPKLIA